MNTDKARLIQDVRDAAEGMAAAAQARADARMKRARAICAAEAGGVSREEIAEAAGLKWPVNRQRWSQLRRGVSR